MRVCETCEGTGVIVDACPYCDGTGVIDGDDEPDEAARDSSSTTEREEQ